MSNSVTFFPWFNSVFRTPVAFKGPAIVTLSFINRNLHDQLTYGKVEERWVTTTDNKEMLVWVIYPPNFDPEKKYPLLILYAFLSLLVCIYYTDEVA